MNLPPMTPREQIFGTGDPASNGKPGGGVAADYRAPKTNEESESGVRVDPASAWHPRSSETFWIVALVAVYWWANRSVRKG